MKFRVLVNDYNDFGVALNLVVNDSQMKLLDELNKEEVITLQVLEEPIDLSADS